MYTNTANRPAVIVAALCTLSLPLLADARTPANTCYDVEVVEIAESLDASFYGVNDKLVFTGNYCVYTDCDPYVVDVADNGVVVGVAAWDGSVYGFLDDGRDVTWFGLDDGVWSEALGVNNRGQVALYDISGDFGAAFVYTAGHLTPLAPDDGANVLSADINNRGVTALEITSDHSRPAIGWPVSCHSR